MNVADFPGVPRFLFVESILLVCDLLLEELNTVSIVLI